MQEYPLSFGTFKFFEDYVTSDIDEGTDLDADKLLLFYSLCYDIFETRPFSVIEIRTCSFSVDPLFYVQYKSLLKNIKSHAIVDAPHSQSSLAEYETAFIQHCPVKTFHTLSEAVAWTKKMNGND